METNVKVKIVFRNEEKTLENLPETFDELKEQFNALFNQTRPEIDYAFKYNEKSIISENSYDNDIELIKDMDDPIIFVEEIKHFLNKSLAISIYNDENRNTNSNNDNNIINNNDSNDNNRNIIINNIINNNIFDQNKTVGDTKIIIPNNANKINPEENNKNNNIQYKELIEKLEEELKNTNEKLKEEINRTYELKAKIENLMVFDDGDGKKEIINKIAKLEKEKKEREEKNKLLIIQKKQMEEKNTELNNELKEKKNELINIKNKVEEKEKIILK